MKIHPVILLLLLLATGIAGNAQLDSISNLRAIPAKYLEEITGKLDRLEEKLDKNTDKALLVMQREEQKLRKKLAKIDSLKATQLFANIEQRYSNLKNKAQKTGSDLQRYIPSLDTLSVSLKFLQDNKHLLAGAKEMKEKLDGALKKVKDLQQNFQKAEDIKQFLKERRQYLKEQLSKFGLAKQMKKMNKQVYYYSQAISEYKNILNDPKKIEAKALALLQKVPAFNKFMRENSSLASLFGISSGSSASGAVSFTGLQTRASVQQLVQNTVAISGASPQQFISQQLQAANQQAASYRNSIRFPQWQENLGDMPDFKPNQQKSKSFLKRLEYGANVQFGRINRLLPATSELALSLGYKLNDNGVIGIGSSYKLGLGNSINRIRFSHQGFGMRSYIDWKIKGSFYVSGGYEKNNLPRLNTISPLLDSWQESGLLGISKKYAVKNRKGYVQVLFDFLSYKNTPRSQPVILRTGINF